MEENKPPPTKLKQAKLSFFKSAPVSMKINIAGQGKKRRNSGSNCLDSPTKLSKLGKPLNLIAVDNTDTQNTKAQKIRKISYGKTSDGNDHEVSSSSELEAGSSKSSNGNFMDRFVRKLPQDCQQEISSTNEMFEKSYQCELAIDKPQSVTADQISTDKCLLLETDVATEPDCIIIDDIEDAPVENVDIDSVNQILCEAVSCNSLKSDPKLSSDVIEICGEEETNILSKANNFDISTMNDDFEKEKDNSIQDVENSALDSKYNSEDNDNSVTSEETLDDSVTSIRDTSILPSDSCSTPKKSMCSNGSDADVTLDLSQITPNTPATGSGQKSRKTDSAKKAEKDALKLKRENERLERKRKLESEKAEKDRIKRERKETKDKQRQELKEKMEKEKIEKERAKEEEKKKKEEERVKKEEEKKKKQEAVDRAKQEEKKKKEEEKKQKEEEKLREEEEKKKKDEKTKQVFQSFFLKPKEMNVKSAIAKPSTGIFIPFELKKDMHLAPAVRRDALTEDKKNNLDQILADTKNCGKTYLEQLNHGDIIPHKTGRILRKNPQPAEDEDVTVIGDSEALKKVIHCVKLLQFHTDYRPPYCGTWRKRPALSPRNPLKKDESVFDYDVDSDEEWEEEEPGESLSCSDGEEEKGEEVDESDDDGWMVPHGYLSEDEGCNEDDEITPEKLKLQQLAKAKAWEEEQKQKLKTAPVITVACFFENSPSNKMAGDVRLLYEFKAVVLTCTPVQTSMFGHNEPEKLEESVSEGAAAASSQKGFQKMAVPDEAIPDLIRLVHGNICGIKRLIREFRVFWLRKSNPSTTLGKDPPSETDGLEDSFVEQNLDSSCLNESVNESFNITESNEQLGDKINNTNDKVKREEGYGCNISKRQLELKISSMAVREKRPGFNKICWYVRENILTQFNMSDMKLPNTWEHLLPAPVRSPTLNAGKIGESPVSGKVKSTKSVAEGPNKVVESPVPKANKVATMLVQSNGSNTACSDVTTELKDDQIEGKETPLKRTSKDQRSIKDFTLSKKELMKKIKIQPEKVIGAVSPKQLVITRKTPKERRKLSSQKCIMDFANMSANKKSLNSNTLELHVASNILGSEHVEVADVHSVAEAESSQSVLTPDTTPVVSQIGECLLVTFDNAQSSLTINTPEHATEALTNSSIKVETMEVDIRETETSHTINATGSQTGIGGTEKVCEIEYIVID